MSIVYKIVNLITFKVYIGITTNRFEKRKQQHLTSFKKLNTYLARAVRKYGIENFKFEIIVEGDFNKYLLCDLEKHYIRLYNSNNDKFGYNMTEGGESTTYVRTKEIRDKISKSLKGRKVTKKYIRTEEIKLKISNSLKENYKNGYILPFCKKCKVFDLNDNLIGTYNSITDVCKNLNIDKGTVRRLIKNNYVNKQKVKYKIIQG